MIKQIRSTNNINADLHNNNSANQNISLSALPIDNGRPINLPSVPILAGVQLFASEKFSQKIRRLTFLMLLVTLFAALVALMGCSASQGVSASNTPTQAARTISVSPSTASIQVWQSLQFSVSGDTSGASCTWQSTQPTVLTNLGSGQFQGGQPGTTQV